MAVHAAPVCLVSPRCRVSDMNWSRDDQGAGRRGYHHGNLREALIRAALDLIAEKGPAGFTFADAARSAGVSSAAPYRHFRDRQALLADVARRGFELFEQRLDRAWNEGRPDPFAAFENVGRAYLAFAREEPAFYSAMFEAGLPLDGDPGLQQAADRAFAVLRKAADAFCARLPSDRPPPPLGASPRDSLVVRARRWRTPPAADDAGGAARSRGVGLPARPQPDRRASEIGRLTA